MTVLSASLTSSLLLNNYLLYQNVNSKKNKNYSSNSSSIFSNSKSKTNNTTNSVFFNSDKINSMLASKSVINSDADVPVTASTVTNTPAVTTPAPLTPAVANPVAANPSTTTADNPDVTYNDIPADPEALSEDIGYAQRDYSRALKFGAQSERSAIAARLDALKKAYDSAMAKIA